MPLVLGAIHAPELRLGTAIVPAFTRGPALMAQSVATIAAIAPSRFVLGIGSSSNVIVESWNGIPFQEPYKKTRDLVRFLKIALTGRKLVIPRQLQFVAERLMASNLRTATADNDINAIRSTGMLPEGYTVNDFLTDTDAFFILTDAPRGFMHFERVPLATQMEADFDTGNMRFKARERYSFGFSDPRCVFGSKGA